MSLTVGNYLFDDPNNPNRDVVRKDPNQVNNSGGEDNDSNSASKCEKCNTNDATHSLTIQVTNTQETETHLLCDPCYQNFIKCQECQNQEITIATLKNNQKIYVCSECNQKLKNQAKQEIIAKEYKAKLNKVLPFINEERYFFTVEKALKADKLTLEQLKKLKTLLVQVWESGTDDSHSIWNKTVYVCPFIEHYLNILDPKIKELENPPKYLRKIQAVNPNCCNGKCSKNLADEPVSESTLTCNSCQTKFTSGFTTHSSSFFCETCGKKNHADGEFKVWIEEIQKQEDPQQDNRENPNQEPEPNPPVNEPQPNPPAGRNPNKPVQNNPSQKCKKCKKQEADNGNFVKEVEKNNQVKLGNCEGWCTVCIQEKLWQELDKKRNLEVKNKNRSLPPNETCQGCGASCRINERTEPTEQGYKIKYRIVRVRWIKYDTNFNEEASYWFSKNCSCEEEFKKENQQICGQCPKREFPDQAKGWLLDYELKKAFCSTECHIKHLNLKNAESYSQILTSSIPVESSSERGSETRPTEKRSSETNQTLKPRVITFPPQLEVSNTENQPDFDWEKANQEKEILYWKESVKELKKQLAESKQKPVEKQHPNELSHQQRQIDFLLKLHQNSQESAKQVFQQKYGQQALNSLLTGTSQNQQPKKTNWGLIGGVGLVGLGIIGGLVFYFWNKRRMKKES